MNPPVQSSENPRGPVLLNIGNTHTQIRCGNAAQIRVADTADFSAELIPPGPCAAACVVPALLPMLHQRGVFLVSPETAAGLLDFSQVDARTLGADRIANAAALAETGPLPAVCIDAGTAVTMEIVGPDRSFLGGLIAPGRTMMRKALHAGTGQLPLTLFSASLPPFPGTCTADAIGAGTDLILLDGIRAACEKLFRRFQNTELRVVVCGGDAPFFLEHLNFAEQAPAGFTLSGVLSVYRRHFPCA